MSDERQNQLILSADKIAICRGSCKNRPISSAKIKHVLSSIFDDFVGQLFEYRTTNFVYVAMVIVYNGRRIFILVISCVCYLFSFIRCRKKGMQVLFCDLHSAVVLADNV